MYLERVDGMDINTEKIQLVICHEKNLIKRIMQYIQL
jgi:hypothetical protein|nr:MAG TPA: hypothetical protein [Caudoviricetes sp.]